MKKRFYLLLLLFSPLTYAGLEDEFIDYMHMDEEALNQIIDDQAETNEIMQEQWLKQAGWQLSKGQYDTILSYLKRADNFDYFLALQNNRLSEYQQNISRFSEQLKQVPDLATLEQMTELYSAQPVLIEYPLMVGDYITAYGRPWSFTQSKAFAAYHLQDAYHTIDNHVIYVVPAAGNAKPVEPFWDIPSIQSECLYDAGSAFRIQRVENREYFSGEQQKNRQLTLIYLEEVPAVSESALVYHYKGPSILMLDELREKDIPESARVTVMQDSGGATLNQDIARLRDSKQRYDDSQRKYELLINDETEDLLRFGELRDRSAQILQQARKQFLAKLQQTELGSFQLSLTQQQIIANLVATTTVPPEKMLAAIAETVAHFDAAASLYGATLQGLDRAQQFSILLRAKYLTSASDPDPLGQPLTTTPEMLTTLKTARGNLYDSPSGLSADDYLVTQTVLRDILYNAAMATEVTALQAEPLAATQLKSFLENKFNQAYKNIIGESSDQEQLVDKRIKVLLNQSGMLREYRLALAVREQRIIELEQGAVGGISQQIKELEQQQDLFADDAELQQDYRNEMESSEKLWELGYE